MKKLTIALLTGVILIGSVPVQAHDKVYGDVYTLEYVYDCYGNMILNKRSMIFMKNKNGIDIEITEKEIEEYEFWKDNNFNNPVYIGR